MTHIIKSKSVDAIGIVRSFKSAQHTHSIQAESAADVLDQPVDIKTAQLTGEGAATVTRLSELETAYAQLEKKYALVKEETEAIRIEAFEKGKAVGIESAEASVQTKYDQLDKRSREALDIFVEKMEAMDGLAAALAHEGLAKIFDGRDDLADLVASAISSRLKQINDEAVLCIVVSTEDFADPGEAKRCIPNLQDDIEVRCDPNLKSGDCKIKLSLGILDINPAMQVVRLQELLQQLAEGG